MGAVTLSSYGDWSSTIGMLEFFQNSKFIDPILETCGQMGVEALMSATPKRTGLTANSWVYEVRRSGDNVSIIWRNTNLTKDGDPVAILLQYGHGTGRGGYVAGRDYINPAMQGVFDNILEIVSRTISSAVGR